MTLSAAERYVQLGLRLGRHDDGVVDAYFGPPELAAAVEAEPLAAPAQLAADAEALLGDLADGWLRDQVAGLHTFARVLAGESLSFADEVHGCYGIRPVHTDEAVFAAAHARLEELLPGSGPLLDRYQSWRETTLVPTGQIAPTIAAVIEEARSQTRAFAELPAGEGYALEMVSDEPWMGYNYYLGDLRGRVVINESLATSSFELLHLAIHETYPGHQAERSLKEHLLVRGQGLIEEAIVLAPTPQSLISEGIGELAPELVLQGEGADAFAAILHQAGLKLDLPFAFAIEQARLDCHWGMVNAALMLNEHGASEAEVQSYLERWGLLNAEQSAHAVRFATEPSSRTYVPVYPVGRDLCRSFVDGQPERFGALLTRQLRVSDLRQ